MVGDVDARARREDAHLGRVPAGGRARRAEGSAGVLVDAQYGPTVAREAKAGGYKLAMPVEKSGQNEFDFEYGEQFGEKIEEYDPDFSKVLVRYNPEGDQAMNERQIEKLRRLSEWLHEHHRKYLFELLVPAEPAQLEKVGGERRPLRHRAAARTDDGGDPPAAERRRRGGHLEDRGHRRPRGVPRDRPARAVARAATAFRAWCSAAARRTRRWTSGCAPVPASRATSGSRSAARSSASR